MALLLPFPSSPLPAGLPLYERKAKSTKETTQKTFLNADEVNNYYLGNKPLHQSRGPHALTFSKVKGKPNQDVSW